MDIEKLIEQLNARGLGNGSSLGYHCGLFDDAATALSTLQAENEKLRAELENYRKGHCSEGGCAAEKDRDLVIAENERLRFDLRRLQTERDALLAANQHLMAEREQLTAERDAAVSDVSAILAEVEEIRRGYGVDNADADNAFANLCGNYCAKCGNNCYEEAENYRCKNYEWRGQKED